MTQLPFLSTTEAAAQLGLSESQARRMCETGELKAQWAGHAWAISAESVKALRANMDSRQERITRQRAAHMKRITGIVKTCPVCGRTVRGLGAFENHRVVCERKAGARERRRRLIRAAHERAKATQP